MYDLTAFQRDLLYAIAGQEEPHGLAIKEELENYYEGEIHHGRLYPNLDTVVDKGLAKKGQADRRTNVYTITDRGLRELKSVRRRAVVKLIRDWSPPFQKWLAEAKSTSSSTIVANLDECGSTRFSRD